MFEGDISRNKKDAFRKRRQPLGGYEICALRSLKIPIPITENYTDAVSILLLTNVLQVIFNLSAFFVTLAIKK